MKIIDNQNFFFGQTDLADGSSTATSRVWVMNIPKMLSSMQRKQFHNVDKAGNAQCYTVRVRFHADDGELYAYTAPNIYATAKAVKAYHDARVAMYKRAGMTLDDLNAYGRTLRPYLNVDHENGSVNELTANSGSDAGIIAPHFQGQEWTYSRAAMATPLQSSGQTGNINEFDLVDTFSFTLLDNSVLESTTADSPDESGTTTDEDSYVSQGMISEWLDSIKFQNLSRDVDSDATIDSTSGLLAFASGAGVASEEILEIAEDINAELRPWDRDGGQYTSLAPAAYLVSKTRVGDEAAFDVPCGLLYLGITNNHTASRLRFTVEVVAQYDMPQD